MSEVWRSAESNGGSQGQETMTVATAMEHDHDHDHDHSWHNHAMAMPTMTMATTITMHAKANSTHLEARGSRQIALVFQSRMYHVLNQVYCL